MLDILLSKDGKPTSLALPRGLQESENYPNPFVNSQADRLKEPPFAKLNFTKGNNKHEITWNPNGKISGNSVNKQALELFKSNVVVPFVIRGHEFRQLVEDSTSNTRYTQLLSWLQLDKEMSLLSNVSKSLQLSSLSKSLQNLNLQSENPQEISEDSPELSDSLQYNEIFKSLLEHRITRRIQEFLDKIHKPMNDIYNKIMGGDGTKFHFSFQFNSEVGQNHLVIQFDFAKNHKSVEPSGYLSDAQFHTLALAFKLAAIEEHNQKVPIILLDDILTSYDLENRYRSVVLLVERYKKKKFQLIFVTHDKLLLNLLREQAGDKNWQFLEVSSTENVGPIFRESQKFDDKISKMIELRFPIGNLIRQEYERWLRLICEDFKVEIPFKQSQYTRSELAGSLAKFLKERKLLLPDNNLNRFFRILRTGTIENFASHFKGTMNGESSTGDEEARWIEYLKFRDQFTCRKCGKNRFTRNSSKKLSLPTCQKCGTMLNLHNSE